MSLYVNPISKNKYSKLLYVLLELVVFAVILLPGVLLEKNGLQEPWTLFRLSRVELSSFDSSIAKVQSSASSYTPERLAEDFLFFSFLHVNFFSLELLSVLSVGSLITPLVYYSFAYHITKAKPIAFALALYGGWYYPRLVSQYGIQTYVWTNLLFIGFLFFFYQWLENKSSFSSLALFVIFVVTFLFYQTTPLWMIAVSSVAYFSQLTNKKIQNKGDSPSWSVPVFMIVLYFTFDTVFWGNYMMRIASESTTESWTQSFLTKVFSPLFPAREISLPPFQISVINPRVATWSTFISLILMVLPIVYWAGLKVYKFLSAKSFGHFAQSKEDIFSWSILGAFLAHLVGYSSYGAISIRLIPLVFPIIILMVFKDQKKGKILSHAFAYSLAFVSIVGFISFFPTVLPDIKPSELGFSPSLVPDNEKILSDATTFGEMQLQESQSGKNFDLEWVDSDKYNAIVNAESKNAVSADYFAFEKNGKPVISSSWNAYQPWDQNLARIYTNPELNKIYESNNLVLMNKVGQDLPIENNFALPSILEQTLFENSLKHFLLFVVILFFPGLAGFLLYQGALKSAYAGGLSFFFISIMFSICMITIVGYVVNFTALGLRMLLPIYLTFAFVLFCVVLVLYKNRIMLPAREIVIVLTLAIIWSGMSSVAENKRSMINTQYTEFFVTRSSAVSNPYITYYVVNRTASPQEFDIELLVDGHAVGEIATNEIKPNSIFSVRVSMYDEYEGKQLTALLIENEVVQKDLHFLYTKIQ